MSPQANVYASGLRQGSLLAAGLRKEGSMIFPLGATQRTSVEKVSKDQSYDAVVVGAGISGSIIAYELSRVGKRVLVLEAGPDGDRTLADYQGYLNRFYAAAAKDNQSPYPPNSNAPMPRSSDARKIPSGITDASGYLVQTGPFSTDTTYTRVLGGTTMHWEGKVLRMLPEDFEMRNRFEQGENWPFSYDELEPYYRMAEREIGVSADVDDQTYLGTSFPADYVFPMRGIPLSYLDKVVHRGIAGTKVTLEGRDYELQVRPFPQGRNGIPNPDYDGGKGYVPVGAVGTNHTELGGRCQGNNNCVPICPIQAKYNAVKTLAKALQTGNVDLLAQSVASKVAIDEEGRVKHIEFKKYLDPSSPECIPGIARAKIYVLSANAIETPRLLLASGLQIENGLVGRNLMDHAYLLSWALMPEVCGTMRGTNCTGGIVELRGGSFRRGQAAFSVDIHNDGWGWAVGSPNSDLIRMVDSENKYGRTLRRDLADWVTRQLQLAFMIEVLPNQSNRVTVDPSYTDALGNMRPIMYFTIPEYTMRGVAYAREFARLVFQRLGAVDYTAYDPGDYGYIPYEGQGYVIRGGNHLAGTHIMGSCRSNSVVRADQRSWAHENLYLVGGGSLPTIGTANVTLTIAAMCFKTAEAIVARLL
jgi:choline dehydrogenase-like flavoprotein